MTDKELMQMALDALDIFYDEYGWGEKQQKAHEALRARLAQPEREWQGLTDEELDQAMDYWSDPSRSAYGGADSANGEYVDMKDTWRYIEAKLKEKNT